jgi:outer membrane protein
MNRGNFLPNIAANSNTNFSSGLSPDQNATLSTTENLNASFNISIRGTIFNGFKNLNLYKQAQIGIQFSTLDVAKIQDDISLNVVNAYLNILFAKENLKVTETQYDISEKQIERAKNQVEAGVKAKGELLNIEATAATDAQNVVVQKNALDLANLNLAQLLQVSPTNFDIERIEVTTPSLTTLFNNEQDVYQKALHLRPEIAKAKLGIENAMLEIAIAKSSFLPSLSYSLSTGPDPPISINLIT